MGADLAEAEHGGQDAVCVGELVLGAGTSPPSALAAPVLVAGLLASLRERGEQRMDQSVELGSSYAGQLRVAERLGVNAVRGRGRAGGWGEAASGYVSWRGAGREPAGRSV